MPGNEVRAFALFLSLGAPMFKFFSLGGAILHLTNASSGVGKSTIQMVANSVWGHPTQAMLVKDDTMLSRYHRMGVVQNMILCIDELTNLPSEDTALCPIFGAGALGIAPIDGVAVLPTDPPLEPLPPGT